MSQHAQIIGKVEYREGDGINITIRPGPCEVDETAKDTTISWADGESRTSVAMPAAVYRRYVENQAIVVNANWAT